MADSTSLIQDTKMMLYSGFTEPVALLSGAHTNSVTTLTIATAQPAIQVNSIVSVDLELMLVTAVLTTTTFTVIRGWLGSTAASHSSGAVATVNPRFSDYAIFGALNDTLDSLSSPANGLFQTVTAELTFSPASMGYNITSASAMTEVLEVTYRRAGSELDWPRITNYDLRRVAETDDFASGFAIVIYTGGSSGQELRVTYGAPFVRFTALGQDAQTVAKLPATCNDILPLGAAFQLEMQREPQRNFNEAIPGARPGSDVPTGAQLQSASGYASMLKARVTEERLRLRQAWPHRKAL